MTFQYKHVLVIGATSGIGKAMADRLVFAGSKVTAVGRRQDRLNEFVGSHGTDKASSVVFDIAETEKIPGFATDIMSKYPDIDCIFLNAGIQNRHDLSQPESFDLSKFNSEINVNFMSFVALTMAFLPFLKTKKTQTSFIITGSNVAIVPASGLSAYSASKAALNSFTLCLRDELRNTNVKVLELSPPPVQTEIHDYMEHGRQFGMPIDQFTEETFKRLVDGEDQIVIGSIGPADIFNEIVDKRRKAFEWLSKMMRQEV